MFLESHCGLNPGFIPFSPDDCYQDYCKIPLGFNVDDKNIRAFMFDVESYAIKDKDSGFCLEIDFDDKEDD